MKGSWQLGFIEQLSIGVTLKPMLKVVLSDAGVRAQLYSSDTLGLTLVSNPTTVFETDVNSNSLSQSGHAVTAAEVKLAMEQLTDFAIDQIALEGPQGEAHLVSMVAELLLTVVLLHFSERCKGFGRCDGRKCRWKHDSCILEIAQVSREGYISLVIAHNQSVRSSNSLDASLHLFLAPPTA